MFATQFSRGLDFTLLKYYSAPVVAEGKAFVLSSLLRLVYRLYTYNHKTQKTKMKVLPSATTGE